MVRLHNLVEPTDLDDGALEGGGGVDSGVEDEYAQRIWGKERFMLVILKGFHLFGGSQVISVVEG